MARRPKTVMLTLRIPADLRAELRRAAEDDHRSVNSLVVSVLWTALRAKSAT